MNMGVSERLVIIGLALGVIFISFMVFMLGLFFIQNRKRSEEFFLKSFPQQMKSLGFFREIPLFGPLYFSFGQWYTKVFPSVSDAGASDSWRMQGADQPAWLNKNTVSYFVILVAGILIVYSIVTAVVSIGGIYIMIEPIVKNLMQASRVAQ